MISLKNIETGETEAVIMENKLDLQNSLSNARQLIHDQVSEFIPSSFWFVYKNAPLSIVQEAKIKLSMITRISSDEYSQPAQRRLNDVVKTSSFWSQRRPTLVWNGSRDDLFLRRRQDVFQEASSRRIPGDVLKMSSTRRPKDLLKTS